MSNLNPIFGASKTRRLVSAWTVQGSEEKSLQRVRDFQDTFDQIILMCGSPNRDGSLPGEWPEDERIKLIKQYNELGVSVLNDYGSTKAVSEELLTSSQNIKNCVRNMVEECERTGADGVDIDFEHLPAVMRFPFTDFFAQLATELHARNKMLSVCVYALSPAARRETGIGFWDTSLLGQYADHVRVMTYDLFCPPSQFIGPTSTAPWGRDTMAYLVSQVPRHKIVMGLPTYSVDWDINDPSQSTQVNDYEWIAEREKESPIGRGWCYYWDVNLIRYNDANGHAHLLWVSDAKSTKSHLVTADTFDVTGVCFWLLNGGDDPAIWSTVRDHFKRW
jgi:spore germination protein YaaH